MLIQHTFPLDAEYEFTMGGGGPGGAAGGGPDVTIDGVRVTAPNTRRFRIPVTAGPHTIGVAVLDGQRGAGVDDAYSDFPAADNGINVAGGVANAASKGTLTLTGSRYTPHGRRIL